MKDGRISKIRILELWEKMCKVPPYLTHYQTRLAAFKASVLCLNSPSCWKWQPRDDILMLTSTSLLRTSSLSSSYCDNAVIADQLQWPVTDPLSFPVSVDAIIIWDLLIIMKYLSLVYSACALDFVLLVFSQCYCRSSDEQAASETFNKPVGWNFQS